MNFDPRFAFALFAFGGLGSAGCDLPSGTGGRAIEFEMQLGAASKPGLPIGSFETSTGWKVELGEALVAIGPVYVHENPPPLAGLVAPRGKSLSGMLWDVVVPDAHAHAGDQHFDGGEVKGEWLDQRAFDVLDPGGVRIGPVPGTEGRARSLSIRLDPPRASIGGDGAALHGHHAYVIGVAEKDGLVIPFEGGLDIEEEGTKRSVDGIPVDVSLGDGTIVGIVIHPSAWFDGAHFDRLTEKNAAGRFVITPESQVRTAWFLGARSFSAFSAETRDAQ
ncbi:hypothetical protein KEG38_33375 [Polyangium jinanense]|uniref:hypothetical protein n=1 Tax=Polyangium jinanense TaxID=2829994 RepID=UPI00233F7E1A|nr:hypothetical protein [Polyangium jinanense]MDC3958795.1 hypothetical protein [Polyangium jinanense]